MHFGKTPEHINYILEDHVDRIKQLEQKHDEVSPIMAGIIAKLESISGCLVTENVLSEKMIDLEIVRMIKNK